MPSGFPMDLLYSSKIEIALSYFYKISNLLENCHSLAKVKVNINISLNGSLRRPQAGLWGPEVTPGGSML